MLLNVMIEAVKHSFVAPGEDLKKPPLLVMAPTANAAGIVGGKTIDSALGFSPGDTNQYSSTNEGRMAMKKFMYEDLRLIVTDEISMVGAMKLAKINYRLQDLAEGNRKQQFMGGISFVASGRSRIMYLFVTIQ